MNRHALRLYHHFPYPLRVLTASARGYYLNRWRYGPQSEQLIAEAIVREQWSPKQWQAWQDERQAYVLERAATRVPYYRRYWAERRRRGDRASYELLQNWPILQKETLRASPQSFVADDCDTRSMFIEHTSGTSGKPLSLWQSRDTLVAWAALFEARLRLWNGVSRHDRWAMVGGQLVTAVEQQDPPFWVWNIPMRQLYMSSYHLAPANIPAYAEALRVHGIRYMLGYASSMSTLAATVLEQGLPVPQLKVVVSNAEPLYQHQRDVIAKAFQCPVRNTYGMSEMVCGASECSADSLHLWPEMGIVEVFDDAENILVPAGQPGRFICTGLLNADMPLIRYEVGDRGALRPDHTTCRCGRTLPMLQEVEGRLDDVVVTIDGRRIGRLDPVFKADLAVREAQIIQQAPDRLCVRFVPASGYTAQHGQIIVQGLRDRVGDMDIVLEPVRTIPRSANGKFRAVVNEVASHGRGRQAESLAGKEL